MSWVRSRIGDFGDEVSLQFHLHAADVLPEAAAMNLSEDKMLLRGHLFEVQHGTTDKQRNYILNWRVACLDNQFPFVKAFHPECPTCVTPAILGEILA